MAPSILQVHASYLVTQDAQGLVIIDQHALHERFMFERLLERLNHGPLESQRLLLPEVLDLDRTLIERAEELAPLLARLGIEAAPISRTALAVQAFPSFLLSRSVEPGPFLRELLERAAAGTLGEGIEAALHETLDMMACKAAVKAGDRLSAEELRELLAARERLERASNCPHGRPTTLRLTIHELDRQFGRG